METTQSIVDYNSEQIILNKEFLEGALQASNASPDRNSALIKRNETKMQELESRIQKNRSKS